MDDTPLSLYWCAAQMHDLPFRFLRLYQCIEYYLPKFDEVYLKRRIGAILSEESFQPSSEVHIRKLIDSVKDQSELTKLEVILRDCMHPDEMRGFVKSEPNRLKYFNQKTGTERRWPKINVFDPKGDPHKAIAARLYSIRNSIVHSKEDARIQFLLPTSCEARTMGPDVELMEFVAQRVIAHYSRVRNATVEN